jgi:hypothetical protein
MFHSSADVPNEARRVENESTNGDYSNAYVVDGMGNLTSVEFGLEGMRRTMRDMGKNGGTLH